MIKVLNNKIRSLSLTAKIILSLLVILVCAYITWLTWRKPPAEAVFWQTVERNLQTNSLATTTEIILPSADLTLLNAQTQLNFRSSAEADFQQQSLIYHQDLVDYYINYQQVNIYKNLNLDQPPNQEWLWQYLRNFDQDIYFKHHILTQPILEDYLNFINNSNQPGAYGQKWYKPTDLQLTQTDNLQLYLMTLLSTDGFLHGNFDAKARQKLMDLLKSAYKIDFDKTKVFHKNNKLFYEYQFKLDYAKFGQALIEYADLHIQAEDQKYHNQLSPEQQAQLLTHQDTIYTVVVDVYARRITEIRYDYAIPFVNYYLQLADYNDFILIPRHSNVINTLLRLGDLGLTVKTTLYNYDQRLPISEPTFEAIKRENIPA
ncbi:MAG: hypothetical protein OXF49_01140 [Candidatus Saccharibacteria bacterium]|nr:hypothetical protein [Candidatus Saccharibacteria bacterium]